STRKTNQKQTEMLKKIVSQGQSWRNHTYYHNDIRETTPDEFRRSTEKCATIMNKYAKRETFLFRPPQGRFRHNFKKTLGPKYKLVFWSLLSMDHASNTNIEDRKSVV